MKLAGPPRSAALGFLCCDGLKSFLWRSPCPERGHSSSGEICLCLSEHQKLSDACVCVVRHHRSHRLPMFGHNVYTQSVFGLSAPASEPVTQFAQCMSKFRDR